jgi:hypothetical protein
MQLQTLRQTIQDTLMDYTFNITEDQDEDQQSPFREVGRVGKMPIPAPYDYDRVERWARGALKALRSEGTTTDEALASTIQLDRIS